MESEIFDRKLSILVLVAHKNRFLSIIFIICDLISIQFGLLFLMFYVIFNFTVLLIKEKIFSLYYFHTYLVTTWLCLFRNVTIYFCLLGIVLAVKISHTDCRTFNVNCIPTYSLLCYCLTIHWPIMKENLFYAALQTLFFV